VVRSKRLCDYLRYLRVERVGPQLFDHAIG